MSSLRNENTFFRLSVLAILIILVLIIHIIFFKDAPGRRFITVAEYQQDSGNSEVLRTVLKLQRDVLFDDLLEIRQPLGEDYVGTDINTLKRQRDDMSRMLNEMKQRIGQLDCEVTVYFHLLAGQ